MFVVISRLVIVVSSILSFTTDSLEFIYNIFVGKIYNYYLNYDNYCKCIIELLLLTSFGLWSSFIIIRSKKKNLADLDSIHKAWA